MKVCIGYKVVDGPWGGGNGFFAGLIRYLTAQGHQVVQDLRDDDIDIILVTDPRFGRKNRAIPFSYNQAWRYTRRNPDAIILHRINECDERKNTRTMNSLLKRCNEVADHTVFVASWLKDLDLWTGPPVMPSSVILNGSDPDLYHSEGFTPWTGSGPLRLVTHHWGGNWMKGFDIYEKLDAMMADPVWKERIHFTYVGNLPSGFTFKNASHVAPKSGQALADELRSHHAYVTGSINEPGGNHQNEGAQCGLPILYLRSGCMEEYLQDYGIAYDDVAGFDGALEDLLARYDYWQDRVRAYPNNLVDTCRNWEKLLQDVMTRRDDLKAARAARYTLPFRLRHGLLP